jgi:uncharacterized cupredoxin-like copper-binding protein
MDTRLVVTPTATHPARRKPLSGLSKWTVAGLVGGVVMLIYGQVVILGQLNPPLAIVFGLPGLLCAGIILSSGWRWAPLLGVPWYGVMVGGGIKYVVDHVMHPEFFHIFAWNAIFLALAVVGVVAGSAATVQNYRAQPAAAAYADRRRPSRWFPALLAVLAGLSLGAILVAAIPRADAGASVSDKALAALPALSAAQTRFDQTELRGKVGEMVALRLENRDTVGHSFDINELDIHVSMPPGQPSLALFKATTPGTYTFYCSVPGHRKAGMVGRLIVEP